MVIINNNNNFKFKKFETLTYTNFSYTNLKIYNKAKSYTNFKRF